MKLAGNRCAGIISVGRQLVGLACGFVWNAELPLFWELSAPGWKIIVYKKLICTYALVKGNASAVVVGAQRMYGPSTSWCWNTARRGRPRMSS